MKAFLESVFENPQAGKGVEASLSRNIVEQVGNPVLTRPSATPSNIRVKQKSLDVSIDNSHKVQNLATKLLSLMIFWPIVGAGDGMFCVTPVQSHSPGSAEKQS